MKMIMDLLGVLKGKTMFSNTFDSQYKHKYSKSLIFILILTLIVPVSISFPQPKVSQAAPVEWVGINGSLYDPSNPLGNGLVSDLQRTSAYTKILFDSYGFPHIMWIDSVGVYYIHWDGTQWLTVSNNLLDMLSNNANVIKPNLVGTGTGAISVYSNLFCLDSNDKPHIMWVTGSGWSNTSNYIRYNGVNWVNHLNQIYNGSNASIPYSYQRFPSFCLDTNNNPHITLCVDDLMTPSAYCNVHYIYSNGTNWLTVTQKPISDPSARISMSSGINGADVSNVMLIDNKPHVTWIQHKVSTSFYTKGIYYLKWDGQKWVTGENNTYNPNSITDNGYISRINGLISSSSGPIMLFDKFKNPCFLWAEINLNNNNLYDIYYIKYNGKSWQSINGKNYDPASGNSIVLHAVSSGMSVLSACLDSNDNPHIIWIDSQDGDNELNYIRWDGSNWVTLDDSIYTLGNANVSRNAGNSVYPSLLLNNSNDPHLLWSDQIGSVFKLLFVHSKPKSEVQNFIKTVDTDGDNDFNDELSKVSIGDEIRYKLSISFTKPGVAGEIMDFVPEGTAYLGMESGHKTPTCSYSDGKDWLYYSKDTEPDNKYAKRNGAVLKWKLNSNDGLNQEIIYKVKVTTNFNEDLVMINGFTPNSRIKTNNIINLNQVNAFNALFNSVSTAATTFTNLIINPIENSKFEITDPIKDQWWTIGTGMNIRWDPSVSNPKDYLTFSVKIDTNDVDDIPDTEMLSKTYQTPIGEGYACVVIDRSTWENKEPLNECKAGDSFEGLLTVTYWKWDKTTNSANANGTKNINIKITKYPVLNYTAWADPDKGLTRHDNRHPMILIHGLSPMNPGGESQLWDALLNSMKQSPAVSIYGKKYKPYVFQYDSGDTFWGSANPKGIEAVGKQLMREIKRNYINLEYAQNEGGLYLIGHSMGGLVARSFMREPMQENKINGPFCGDGVTRLITLATPHHGTNYANLFSLFTASQFIDNLKWDDYINKFNNSNNVFLINLNNPQNKHLLFEDKIIALASSYDKVELHSGMFYASPQISNLKYHTNKSIDFGYLDCSSFVEYEIYGTHFAMAKDQIVLNSIQQFLHAPIVETKLSANNNTVFLDVFGQGFGDRQGKTSFKIAPNNSLTTAPIVGTLEWSNTKISATFQPLNAPNPIAYKNQLMQISNSLQTSQFKVVINIEGNGAESSTSEDFPSANIIEIEPVKKDVELTLIPSKSIYCRGDTISMKLRVKNNSKLKISDPQLSLAFPKELAHLSSRPQGSATLYKWSISIGNLNGGTVFEAELKFKLKGGYSIPEQGINLSFTASFTSSGIDPVKDYATVKYVSCAGTENISMTINWTGLNTKTNTAKSGDEISAKITPEGGSSPYQITIDWGDGSDKSRKSDVTSDNPPTLAHTYNEAGEYTITIICTDQYGNVCKIIRKVKVD